jgi:tetratricopeptide (TPR) repeat protein
LNRLLDRLAAVTSWDTRFERAQALRHFGMIRYNFEHHPAEAIAPLEQAAVLFEELEGRSRLPDGTSKQSGVAAEGPARQAGPTAIDSTNRAATLGDLANALRDLGRFDEALDAAERGLALDRDRNDQSAAERGLGQIAQILQQQGRYDQAETRYHEALEAAQDAGDDEAAGSTWQGLGIMNNARNRPDEAASALRQALDAFTRAGDTNGQMRVFNSLGNIQSQCGNAEAALARRRRATRRCSGAGGESHQSRNTLIRQGRGSK